MSEIMRFKTMRSPQRHVLAEHRGIPLYLDGLSEFAENVLTIGAASRSAIPTTFLQLQGVTYLSVGADSSVNDLDAWLIKRKNKPRQRELLTYLADLADEGSHPVDQWLASMADERVRLADMLIASFLSAVQPALRARLARFITIIGLVELLRDAPKAVSTSEEIFQALSQRCLLLPKELLGLFENVGFRRSRTLRAGFSDLYLTREEWVKYEAGEISHIENVRQGELKERKLSRLSEREDTATFETETTSFDERSIESTDRFELSEETSRESELGFGIDVGVDTSGKYGLTQVDTHVGGNVDYSLTESSEKATQHVKESISRAVSRIEKRMREVRSSRTLTRTESYDLHSLKNDTPADKVAVYRWVNKIKRVQIFRYPNRYLLEFQIPEPGAWWRWLMSQPTASNSILKKPVPFTLTGAESATGLDLIRPSNIDASNYLALGARYFALGLEPPPADKKISTQVSSVSDGGRQNQNIFVVEKSLGVPEGYVAATWTATVVLSAWDNQGGTAQAGSVLVSVGAAAPVSPSTAASSGDSASGISTAPMYLMGNVGNLNSGTIPIAVSGFLTDSYAVNIAVSCQPTNEKTISWKVATYEKIAAAYAQLNNQYEEDQRNFSSRQVGIVDRFSPPRNQEIILQELKKHVVSMLTGNSFGGRMALSIDTALKNEPSIDLQLTENSAPEIQFIEQAFEWSNLSYVLYPYFWTGKTRWADVAAIDGADPNFVRFLTSGSARVIVPARPGFEQQVQLFSAMGILWGGGPVPAPNDPEYLSIAEEIRSLQRPPGDGERGESWDISLPTSLICLGNGGTLPANTSAVLDAPPGRTFP